MLIVKGEKRGWRRLEVDRLDLNILESQDPMLWIYRELMKISQPPVLHCR